MKPTKACVERLTKEHRRYKKDPIPNIRADPDPSNILEWHFVIQGEANTPYAGGTYHGKLLFPADYPFKPPGIMIMTPSGRFVPGTKICFSFSDFHPEAWNPIWHVATILNATVSFMNEDTVTTGCTKTSLAEKRRLARESLGASCKNPAFRRMFPDLVEQHKAEQQQLATRQAGGEASTAERVRIKAETAAKSVQQPRQPWLQQQLESLWKLLPTMLVAVLAIGIVIVQYRSALKQ